MDLQLDFQPRPYQIPIIKALNSGTKRAVWVVHRRGGKDVTAFNWCILQLLVNAGWTAFHILPKYSQAKKVIWDSSTNDGKRILDYIPKELVESKNSQQMQIRLTNGSLYQLIGSDNIDSLLGTNPKIIIFSEYAIQSPAAWTYLRPILDVNKGYALFISTPRGKNHFYDLVNMARANKEWFCEVLSINDTGVLNEKDIEKIRAEGMSDEFIQQEYYCSFNRGVEGSYYGRLIEKARDEKRICNVGYETRSPVHTAWDIGYGDSTSITFWQEIGGEIRIIDFYENNGEGIAHYAKVLQTKPYVYGSHYMPHDAGSGSIQTGRTLQDVAYEQGLKTIVLEREIDISIGIEATRALLSTVYIDEIKCMHLIKCLENYHKKYNEKTQAYSETPMHDYCSHACFIGETLISTDSGLKQISDICIGDMVKTPFGFRRVLETHKYSVNELCKLKTSNGKELTCTRNHKIFTEKTLDYCDTLRYNQILINEENDGLELCQKYIGYRGEKTNLGFRDIFLLMNQKQELSLMEDITNGMDFTLGVKQDGELDTETYIEQFGHSIMERYQKITTFITSMLTPKTMTFQTCNACTKANTLPLMQKEINGLEAKQINNNLEKITRKQKNGMQAQKGKSGILTMERKDGKLENGLKSFAAFAERQVKPLIPKEKKFVLIAVKLLKDIVEASIILQKNVQYALKNFKIINILQSEHVETCVLVNCQEKPADVYDITVDIDHCYFANGILVSNSDSVRYMANARIQYGRGPGSLTPEKLQQLKVNAGFGPKPVPMTQRIQNNPFLGR